SAIAGLLREHLGAPADPRTRPTIEGVTQSAPIGIGVEPDGSLRLVPAGEGVDHAMAEIVAALYRVQSAGELERLKLCKACGFAFYDTSKNRSRIWCDMALCGSQEKARAYRKRLAERPE
ncbi:MAG: CGNR zinc finger domain-containing protein, partial [Dehalococcoidia bacterium]